MKTMRSAAAKMLSLVLVLSMLFAMMSVAVPTGGAYTVQPTTLVRQDLAKWKNYVYGDSQGTLYRTGCGMFAIVNAVGYLTGNTMSVTEVASWGHSIGGYNPGNTHAGTYRMTIYPRLQAKYGERYGFTVDCGSTNEGYWAGSSSSTLKNHLKNGGVAIGHVPGHFIAIVGYDSSTNYFHVYDSYPTSARGTGNGDAWVTQSHLATGKLKLDWFCLLSRTGTVINNQVMQKNYTVTFDSRGGSAVAKQTVEEGKYATKPADPTRAGFEFAGWYDEDGYEFLFETTGIWANRSLHALWKAIEWPQTTEYMPASNNTVADAYSAEGDHYVWPYFDPYTGGLAMYKGGEGYGWPSVTATYETSVDLSKYAYLNVAASATAQFNADITFLDANAEEHSVRLSQIINGTDADFAPGDYVLRGNVGYYLYSHYSMPASGVVNIKSIKYFVVGETDQYVKLNTVCFTAVQDYANPMIPDTLAQTPVAGASGSYTYDNGTLTVEGTGGYNVTFRPNITFEPQYMPYWIIAAKASTNFDISMIVTTSDGDRRVSLVDDYYNHFGFTEYPELGLKDGQYTRALHILGMYEWNNVLPADGKSVIKEVSIELRGNGGVSVSACQMGNTPVVEYFKDGVTKSDSWAGSIRIDNDRYVLDEESDVILTPNASLNVGTMKGEMENSSYIHLYENGTEITDSAKAKTGQVIRVMNGGTLIAEYTLAVRGDVDENGEASTTDVRKMVSSVTEENAFSAAALVAGDLNKDGVVSTIDARDLLLEMISV
ncbi:MAG: InlB B-repeat-containing protein [Clostridia bacterium]|nr:InlB B-repeat-containing protein [Clostridia bacterium]